MYIVSLNYSLFNEGNDIRHYAYTDKEMAIKSFHSFANVALKMMNCGEFDFSTVGEDDCGKQFEVGHNTFLQYIVEDDDNDITERTIVIDKHGSYHDFIDIRIMTEEHIHNDEFYVVTDDCSYVVDVEDFTCEFFSDKVLALEGFRKTIKTAIEDMAESDMTDDEIDDLYRKVREEKEVEFTDYLGNTATIEFHDSICALRTVGNKECITLEKVTVVK